MLRLCKTLFAAAIVLVSGLTSNAFAQGITTGSISGSTVDSGGAAIVGAQIHLANSATGAKFQTVSGPTGEFSVRDLPIGTYTVTLSASGFAELKVADVSVTSGNTSALGKQTLNVGSSATEVTVEGVVPLLNTTQAQVSTTFSSEQLQDLPLNNGFDTVALLVPGTVQTHDNNFSNTNGEAFSSNGQRGRSNNFEIDGQSNNDNSVAGPQVFFGNQDAIAELQVITNNFSAQYGRNMGSVINYLTKSGTNTFHGSGFEFWQGSTFQSLSNSEKNPLLGYCTPGESPVATGCAPVVLTRYVENRFGGTLGGPALKDKLWLFGSGYYDRSHYGGGNSVSGTALTPNAAGIAALTAAFPGNPGVVALATNGPTSIKLGNPTFYGPVVNQDVTVNGTTISVPFQAISRSVPSQSNDEEALGRGDWQPTTKDHLFLRYFYQNDPYLNGGGSVPAGSWYNVPDTAHSVGADWTHVFTTNWLDQLRYSFQQTSLLFQGGALPNCTATTPDQCTSTTTLQGTFQDAGGNSYSNLSYGYADNIPQGRVVKVTQVQDNASWVQGRHNIQFGGEWDYQNSPNPFLPYYSGGYVFSSFNSFLTGAGTLSLGNGPFTSKFTENDYALYFQDDWKLNANLTLNLGLRWEFYSQAINLLHNETVARESNPATAFWDTSLPLSERTFPKTGTAWKNYQPRIGFAYNPAFANHLVVRGGFAINFDPAFYNMFLNSATAAPVVNLGTVRCDGVATVCQSPAGALGSDTRSQGLPFLPLGGNPNGRNQTSVSSSFHNPYTESYTLGMSYQLGQSWVVDAHYVGNHTVGNFQSLNANPDLLGTAEAFPNFLSPSAFCQDPTQVGYGRPNCAQANVRERANTAFSIYNALQLKAESRSFHGLTGQVNYTFSKTIDNSSDVFSTFAGGNSVTFAPNPFDVDNAERALSGISVPQVTSVSAVYQLPIYKQDRSSLPGRLLGGIQLNGIYQFDTGQPATPYQLYFNQYTGNTSYCDNAFQSSSFGSSIDSCRPILSNPKAPVGTTGFYATADDAANAGLPSAGWYNYVTGAPISGPQAVHFLHNDASDVAAIGSNTPFPGVGRSILRATHFSELDTSVYKSTPITERLTLQLQITAFNVLNQQFYGTPDPEIEDPSFQQTYYNGGSHRNLQFGGKFIF